MPRLILMRHAKSDWGDPSLDDHARPLNPRGTRSARALGNWLRARGWLPGEVLCSTATRTRDTLAGLHLDAPTRFLPALYHAAPETMLDALATAQARTVLLIGHNPGIGILAQFLAATPPTHDRFDDYPTGATLVLDCPGDDWTDVRPDTTTVLDFVIPRELEDGADG